MLTLMERMNNMNYKNLAMIAGGFLMGTAGVKLLSSRDAKKVYAHTTAAVIRMKDCIMKTVTDIREGCGDIYAEAKEINENIACEEICEEIEDTSDACAEDAEE